jgi:hypothetical protein
MLKFTLKLGSEIGRVNEALETRGTRFLMTWFPYLRGSFSLA